MSEFIEALDKLPLSKKASPTQIIYLLLAIISLLTFGWVAKGYFDAKQAEIVNAINMVGKSTEDQAKEIDAVKRFYWSNADQQSWALKLDRNNRALLPALQVPEVPPPAPAPAH